MSQDEEQQRRSRVVVETPTARREVVHSQTVRTPERTGHSTGMIAAVALAAIAATAIIFLFLMNRGDNTDNTNINVRSSAQPTPVQQQPVIVQQQPLPQATPIIIQQPAPVTTQPAPVIITQPAAPPTTATTTSAPPSTTAAPKTGNDDATLQTNIDRAFSDDQDLNSADVTAVIVEGKVTLNGTVKSEELKRRAERLAYRVKGVRSVDNKILVVGG